MENPSKKTGFGLAAVAVLLLIWELAARGLEVRPDVLPSPSRILLEIERQAPKLQDHILVTCSEILGGLFPAAISAIPLAVLIVFRLPWLRGAVDPISSILWKLPLLSLAPLFLIWFGFGTRSKIYFTFLICLCSITPAAIIGLRSIPTEMLELARTTGAGPIRTFFKIHLPAMLPCYFTGFRAATTLALVGAITAEFVEADKGLGFVMLAASSKMDAPLLFATLAILALIGLALRYGTETLERITVPWRFAAPPKTGTSHD